MQNPTKTGKPAPKPIDDPLAQLVDKFADEVEPATTDEGSPDTPTTFDGESEPTA